MRSDTTPPPQRDLATIWAATQDRIGELLRPLPEESGNVPVPTIPGVTVRDVVVHLSRSIAEPEIGALPLPAVGAADPGAPVAELMSEWQKAADAVRDRRTDPSVASVLITVAAMAEHDLRTALNAPGARDDVAVKVALDELAGRFSDRVAAAGLPSLRVTVEQWGTIAGSGRATSCVVADRFEFVRAMSGRRSAAEIRRWNWGVEPDIYLPAISETGLPANDIHERDPRIPEHMKDREFVL